MTIDKFYYIPVHKENVKRRLFCFPFAGGLASYYFSFEHFVPTDVELVAVQYPGRFASDNIGVNSINELINFIYSEINTLFDKPFSFFGHSMGAIVAYELAKKLQNNFQSLPQYLFLSGRSSPDTKISKSNIHTLNDIEFTNKLKSLNGIPIELINNNIFQQFLPTIRNDIKIIETWELNNRVKLKIPLVLFNGDSDPEVEINTIDNWSLFTSEELASYIFSGNHFFINQHKKEIFNLIFKKWNSSKL